MLSLLTGTDVTGEPAAAEEDRADPPPGRAPALGAIAGRNRHRPQDAGRESGVAVSRGSA